MRMASYERAALVAPSTERMLPAVLCAEDRLSEAKIFDLTATDSDRQLAFLPAEGVEAAKAEEAVVAGFTLIEATVGECQVRHCPPAHRMPTQLTPLRPRLQ